MNILDTSAGNRDEDVSLGPASGTFNDKLWIDLLEMIGSTFSFDVDQIARMRKNPVLKLVAALPYLANCDEPSRTALSHMSVFILAGASPTKKVFSHNFKDSAGLERRLERISHFPGGNQQIIDPEKPPGFWDI